MGEFGIECLANVVKLNLRDVSLGVFVHDVTAVPFRATAMRP